MVRRPCGTDIDREINWLIAHNIPDFLDDSIRANRVDLACLDALETRLVVVDVVGGAGECRPDGAVLSNRGN